MKHTPITNTDTDVEDLCKSKPKKVTYDTPDTPKTSNTVKVPFIIPNLPVASEQARDDLLGGFVEQ